MIVRIAGVTLPQEKQIDIALTSIFGVGVQRARKILKQVGISTDMRTRALSDDQVQKLRKQVEQGGFSIEGELRREMALNIRRLKEIGSYRGSRHAVHLPARGQRTKTNSRTVRGNIRRTMGSGKKPPAQKT